MVVENIFGFFIVGFGNYRYICLWFFFDELGDCLIFDFLKGYWGYGKVNILDMVF